MEGTWIIAIIAVAAVILLILFMSRGRGAKDSQAPAEENGGPRSVQSAFAPAPVAPLPVRENTPGPPLTRKDDALYAVVSAAIAQALAAEGVNPEGGFEIKSLRAIEEMGKPLTMEDDAFYALITAAVSAVLQEEGVNPEGGFRIESVAPVKG